MTATAKIHGIRNCDTMKKAFAWLDAHGIAYDFHDYKKAGVSELQLSRWCDAAGWESVLNRAGTTFRKLPDGDRQDLTRDKAIALMAANPSMIKRPILEFGDTIEIGFRPERYAALFGVNG
jgi:Spx/MgsR family transcriptional regulator